MNTAHQEIKKARRVERLRRKAIGIMNIRDDRRTGVQKQTLNQVTSRIEQLTMTVG